MTGATFGDFLRQAEEHLARARDLGPDPITGSGAAAGELRRVVVGMARYLEDRAPVYVFEAVGVAAPLWERAVADARTALRWAAGCLAEGTETASSLRPGEGLAGCLADAAASLAAGRDLLHTHLAMAPGDLWEPRSPWAPVVMSAPVTRALTVQIARWSSQLAMVAARLAAASPASPAGLQESLQGAAQWLWLAETAVRPAQAAQPVTAGDRSLLHAIPAASSVRRQPPGAGESVADLCAGAVVSAERLRSAVFVTAQQGRWAPLTADTWRWTAAAAAVTGHASEGILRSLADHPSWRPAGRTHLQVAAGAVAEAGAAWRRVATGWLGLTTGTRGLASPVVTEINDLVVRLGRLAWDDPRWTPAQGQGAALRPAASLAADGRGLGAVVAAVHQAADAFTAVAAADLEAITAADGAGQLYVPTRTLSDKYDIPRRYATAPADRTRPLLVACTAAAQASAHAAGTLAALALALDGPSSMLALARAAVPHSHTPGQDQPAPAPTPTVGMRTAPGTLPGPVELAVRRLRVSDPVVLLHAAVIDQAAQQVITQAAQASSQPSPWNSGTPPQRLLRGGAPARLAANDSPAGLAPGPAGSRRNQTVPGRPAPQADRKAPPVRKSGRGPRPVSPPRRAR